MLLQTGPETFDVHLGGGRAPVPVVLPHHTRRGLDLGAVAPVVVATEIVRFLLEHGEVLRAEDGPVQLGAAAGRHAGFYDELRGRLA